MSTSSTGWVILRRRLRLQPIIGFTKKVLVSFDDRLLAQIDREARKAGLSRSAYLARLAERELGTERGPGASPEVARALSALRSLGRRNPTPGDPTELIRKQRDSR